jgi:two-component system LytT family sensor kinase
VIVNLIFNQPTLTILVNYLFSLVVGVILTHIYRFFILKFRILQLKIPFQMVFIVFSSFLLSVIFCAIGSSFFVFSLEVIINGIVPFIFWSLIYFGFHYLQNYKRTEIQNLRWEASSKEIELNKLKSQLNPHFMFNSMNSIRALIDEDPAKAKMAVTQLSNILRNTLLMNKNKEILLEEELNIVKDYLALEHIRFEERLKYDFNIEEATLKINVPPLIIQAQVENAIKHGISKLPKGGNVNVSAQTKGKDLFIEINNTGQLSNEQSETGFGLANSKHRLDLLYGTRAFIEIANTNNNEVSVKIKIPFN